MRKPTNEELAYIEDNIADDYGIEVAEITLSKELNDGWLCKVYMADMDDGSDETGVLWYDKVEDEFHFNFEYR